MYHDLLTCVTARLRYCVSSTEDNKEAVRNWQVGQPRPYQIGRLVVIPAYNDGHMTHPQSFIWKGKNGMYHVRSAYGVYDYFPSMLPAIHFALEV